MERLMKILRRRGGMVVVAAAAFAAGALLRGGGETPGHGAIDAPPVVEQATVWTCSMHPQIQLPEPGKCPICSMDLIPLVAHDQEEGGPRELSVSDHAAALMELETTPVERRFVNAEVRMVGKVAYDETRLSTITAWVPGRLERLFVDYTGVAVSQGDHLVELYSPELLSAQEELLQAAAAARRLTDASAPAVRRAAEATAAASREKLRLWGLTPPQIEGIEQRGSASDRVTIYAPAGGIVVHMYAREGMYVKTGAQIYTIADLTRVWVELNAYESDLHWVRYGQEVVFAAEAYPGKSYRGTIAFIQPVLDEGTRTVKVRVNVENPDLELKPGMFVRARVLATVAEGGHVASAALAGKWISPMHPEVVKDEPGSCDVCGMALVRAEDLGYVTAAPAHAPLVIPASAPLITGRRAVVYVELAGRDRPTYEGREVTLGPKAGDYFTVEEGLSEGERVVINGAFKLDAELQIRARPSMMSPEGGVPVGGHGAHGSHGTPSSSAGTGTAMSGLEMANPHRDHAESPTPDPHSMAERADPSELSPAFAGQLGDLVKTYLDIQESLASDRGDRAAQLADAATRALGRVDMSLVHGADHVEWMSRADSLEQSLKRLSAAADTDEARRHFSALSEQMLATVKHFGAPDGALYQAYCPMALDFAGATWIQGAEEISNPYFGASMLRCGTIQEVLQ